jgi:HK97 family phage prohead protease
MLHPWTPVAETKRAALPPRALAADGTIAGYASLFGRVDLGGDLVVPGAFAASLRGRGARGIRMLFQHDPAEPIGVWEAMREDARGLYVEGRLALGVGRAREILALLRQGAVDGLSIGFKADRTRRDRAGIRRLERVDLWEISVVTFPMLPGARVTRIANSE